MVRGSLPASFPADPDSPLKSRRTPGPAEPIHPDQERCRNCTAPFLVSEYLASRFKLNKASDTTSDSSQICRVLTQMPHKLTHYITLLPLLKPNSPDSVSEDCFLGEGCIGIRSCSAVVEQLQRAKATQDSVKRNEIIQAVRDKVKIFLDSEDLKL